MHRWSVNQWSMHRTMIGQSMITWSINVWMIDCHWWISYRSSMDRPSMHQSWCTYHRWSKAVDFITTDFWLIWHSIDVMISKSISDLPDFLDFLLISSDSSRKPYWENGFQYFFCHYRSGFSYTVTFRVVFKSLDNKLVWGRLAWGSIGMCLWLCVCVYESVLCVMSA